MNMKVYDKESINFSIAELEGRKRVEAYFKHNNITAFQFTKNRYDKFDVMYMSKKGNKIIAEIKMRDDSWSNVMDMQIEETKYNDLLYWSKQLNAVPVYINVFKSVNKIKIARITDLELEWKMEEQPNYSCIDGDPILKSVAYIKQFYVDVIS